ncbi:hypothetical protein SALBM311S_02869 [Streptomyces alboniger]
MPASGSGPNTFSTEPGKSVLSAPFCPPASSCLSLKSLPSVPSALTTDASVHFSLWVARASYFSGPAWER